MTETLEIQNPDVISRKRKIFYLGVAMLFFTSMSKVLVPGTVFDPLQHELSLNAEELAGLGAWYMYSYALSQLGIGMLADRLGGVRILIWGGLTFCFGSLLFPLASNIWLLRIARMSAGFGAGIEFLGVTILVADLFPTKFSAILGYSLVIGYLGPVVGTAPMVGFVGLVGWRWALLVPALLSLVVYIGTLLFVRGTISPVKKGVSVWRPVLQVMGNWDMVKLCTASSLMFGVYYALLTLMGRKCLEDVGGFEVKWAALTITLMTILVAGGNFMSGFVCKVANGRYSLLMKLLMGLCLVGVALGWSTLTCHWSGWLVWLSYILICIPAGFFPVYGTMAKDISPKDTVALSVALVNFWAFVMIALVGHCAGLVMRSYEDQAVQVEAVLKYPVEAYQGVFYVLMAAIVVGFACTFGIFRRSRQASAALNK